MTLLTDLLRHPADARHPRVSAALYGLAWLALIALCGWLEGQA